MAINISLESNKWDGGTELELEPEPEGRTQANIYIDELQSRRLV